MTILDRWSAPVKLENCRPWCTRVKSNRRSFDSLRSLRMTAFVWMTAFVGGVVAQRQEQPQVLRLAALAQDDKSSVGVASYLRAAAFALDDGIDWGRRTMGAVVLPFLHRAQSCLLAASRSHVAASARLSTQAR